MVKWYDPNATDNPPFLRALAEVRKIGVHEGWCYHHVQAIMLSIAGSSRNDQNERRLFVNLTRYVVAPVLTMVVAR